MISMYWKKAMHGRGRLYEYWMDVFHGWFLLLVFSPFVVHGADRTHCCLHLQIGNGECKEGAWALNSISSDVTDCSYYTGFGKDNVYFSIIQTILNLFLFHFCQYQELNPQKSYINLAEWLQALISLSLSLKFSRTL